MPNSTNALDLLGSQREEVIENIEKSSGASDKAGLFEQLADQLAAHVAIEEQLFGGCQGHPRIEHEPPAHL